MTPRHSPEPMSRSGSVAVRCQPGEVVRAAVGWAGAKPGPAISGHVLAIRQFRQKTVPALSWTKLERYPLGSHSGFEPSLFWI